MADSEQKSEWTEEILARLLDPSVLAIEQFEDWYEPIKQNIDIASQEVLDAVEKDLEGLKKEILGEEASNRSVFNIFQGNGILTKSADSIRSKIARELKRKRTKTRLTKASLEKVVLSFDDLGRFRVICGFPSDVRRAIICLLGEDRELLCGKYPVDGFKDSVTDLSKRKLGKGHRAYQFSVKVDVGTLRKPVLVEIQLMTPLQHAWDQRNHPCYEMLREGQILPDHLIIKDVALAETLYLVDEQADRNWKEILEHQRRGNK